jgi:hypothetical protein
LCSIFHGKVKAKIIPEENRAYSKKTGDLISADGWGPLRYPDWNGNTHYLVFIDHYSKKSFKFLYASPAQVSDITVNFLKGVATFLGRPVKTFRADKEGGYVSNKVKNYCKSVGTRIE